MTSALEVPSPVAGPPRSGRWAAFQARQPLLADTGAVFFSLAANGALGFVFWVVAARLYPAESVGIGSTLTAVMFLMGNVSRLGLDFALTVALPREPVPARRHALIQGSLLLVGLVGALAAAVFVGQPFVADATRAVLWQSPAAAVSFIALCAAWGVGLVGEQVLLVSRRSAYIVYKNLAFSVVKLVALVGVLPFVSARYGVLAATEVGVFAGLAVAWLPLRRLMPWRWTLIRAGLVEIRATLAGAALGNQVSALIAGLPNWLLPLIVVERAGTATAAYFYTAWMIMTLVNTGPAALAAGLLAEGARQGQAAPHLLRKAYRYTALFMVPATAAVLLGAPLVLPLFGPDYAGHGLDLLRYLAVAGLPFAVVQINFMKLRLDGQLAGLGVAAVLLAGGALGGSYLLLPALGLAGVGLAWLASCSVVAGFSGWLMWWPPRARKDHR